MDPAVRAQLHQPGGHLAAAGVVDADEQHLGAVGRDQVLGLGERLQPLAREAVREHGHEDGDLRVAEQVQRLGDVPLDRLDREDPRELGLQPGRSLLHVMLRDRIKRLAHISPRYRQGSMSAAV